MKLCRYNNYNPETKSIIGESKPAYYFYQVSNVPEDYTNINSIENIETFGFNGSQFDYKKVRDILKIEVENIGWDNLTSTQKTIAASHKIGTNTQRAAALGNDYILMDQMGQIYHEKVMGVRFQRMNIVKSMIHNRLGHIIVGPYTGPEIVLAEVTETIIIMYQNEGLGGIFDGDNSEGLMDYINETTGTIYAGGNGLRSKTWVPFGYLNCNDFCMDLLTILQNGQI